MINHSKFSYSIDIRATPAQIWSALINPQITVQYWRHKNISDWKISSKWWHVADDNKSTIKLTGDVLEVIPLKLLVLTWSTPKTPEDISRVTFKIEKSINNGTCLKIIHDNLKSDSEKLKAIKTGWPKVLSSLKSFLETGHALVTWEN